MLMRAMAACSATGARVTLVATATAIILYLACAQGNALALHLIERNEETLQRQERLEQREGQSTAQATAVEARMR